MKAPRVESPTWSEPCRCENEIRRLEKLLCTSSDMIERSLKIIKKRLICVLVFSVFFYGCDSWRSKGQKKTLTFLNAFAGNVVYTLVRENKIKTLMPPGLNPVLWIVLLFMIIYLCICVCARASDNKISRHGFYLFRTAFHILHRITSRIRCVRFR